MQENDEDNSDDDNSDDDIDDTMAAVSISQGTAKHKLQFLVSGRVHATSSRIPLVRRISSQTRNSRFMEAEKQKMCIFRMPHQTVGSVSMETVVPKNKNMKIIFNSNFIETDLSNSREN